MLTCEHATSRVTRTGRDGKIEVLATHYRGRELNSPNDIVVKRDGFIYFTDPTLVGCRFSACRASRNSTSAASAVAGDDLRTRDLLVRQRTQLINAPSRSPGGIRRHGIQLAQLPTLRLNV